MSWTLESDSAIHGVSTCLTYDDVLWTITNTSTGSCNYEIKSNPSEDLDSVVVIDAEEVHQNKANGDEHPHKTDCEEKLCGHKEWRNKIVANFIIALCKWIEDPSTACVKAGVGQIIHIW